jgi:hypothetical protein
MQDKKLKKLKVKLISQVSITKSAEKKSKTNKKFCNLIFSKKAEI